MISIKVILKDLGYIKALDLKIIEEKEAFYSSRVKVVTILYKKRGGNWTWEERKPSKKITGLF